MNNNYNSWNQYTPYNQTPNSNYNPNPNYNPNQNYNPNPNYNPYPNSGYTQTYYQASNQNSNPDPNQYSGKKNARQENIDVWLDTERLCSEGGLYSNLPVKKSIKYATSDLIQVKPDKRYPNPILYVINADTFTVAKQMVDCGYDPAVLNMANHINAGGGVKNGAGAQEENLFRRSNYHKFLTEDFYPIDENELIYSKGVTVFKDKNYIQIKPFQVSCIASAALRNPPVTEVEIEQTYEASYSPYHSAPKKVKQFSRQEDYDLTKEKITNIFKVAKLAGHDSLLVGAYGCGAFCGPNYATAQIFNEVMKEFRTSFYCICFGIYSQQDDNYKVFKEVLKL